MSEQAFCTIDSDNLHIGLSALNAMVLKAFDGLETGCKVYALACASPPFSFKGRVVKEAELVKEAACYAARADACIKQNPEGAIRLVQSGINVLYQLVGAPDSLYE
jgi:hypothetical protein